MSVCVPALTRNDDDGADFQNGFRSILFLLNETHYAQRRVCDCLSLECELCALG